MVLLGMTARHLAILSPEALREAIRTVFARKGEKVVEDNLKAFDAGYEGI
jgi:indolepyruvate ferredoxin oxidoreductase beta subunit